MGKKASAAPLLKMKCTKGRGIWLLLIALVFIPLPAWAQETTTDTTEKSKNTQEETATPEKKESTQKETKKDADKKKAAPEKSVKGYITFQSVTRKESTTSFEDKDLYLALRLTYLNLPTKKYGFHFFGTVRSDQDGSQNVIGGYPLEGISDTYKDPTVSYLYESHALFNHVGPISQLRLGRQSGKRGERIYFDGMALDFKKNPRWGLALYGGRAVHHFDVNLAAETDSLAGVGFDLSRRGRTRVSLDYLFLKDRRDPVDDLKDELISLLIRRQFSPSWQGLVKTRHINHNPRDVHVRLNGKSSGARMGMNLAYYRRSRMEYEISQEVSSFASIMGLSHPFHSLKASFRWGITPRFSMATGGFTRKMLEPETVEGPFNREFSRLYLVGQGKDLFFPGFSASLTTEKWKAGTFDVSTSGYELAYRKKGINGTRIQLGNYYSLYKYDYYLQLGERTSVRTNYLKARIPVGKSFSFTGAYETEDGAYQFKTLKAGMRYVF